MQEDLAALFARQMTVEAAKPLRNEAIIAPAPSNVTYSISQHYHHSAHIPRKTVVPRASPNVSLSPPCLSPEQRLHELLQRHNIDPTSLSPSQLQLFDNADPEQQSRLLQIWQICSESVDRGDRRPNAMDATIEGPGYTISAQGMDIDMSGGNQMVDSGDDSQQYAEPYMIHGYEMLAPREQDSSVGKVAPFMNEPTTGFPYKPANDPVYQFQSQRWWERPQQGPVGYQYGAIEEMDSISGCGLVRPSRLA
ncbi:hypothetical protein BDV59DRAFT_170515 [Aspergillus ambiguus]|uniref:uncharacterized protein n=1 Tax=Aspergillus ambiguus TaxID=176160 RepID=UPI003CCCFA56